MKWHQGRKELESTGRLAIGRWQRDRKKDRGREHGGRKMWTWKVKGKNIWDGTCGTNKMDAEWEVGKRPMHWQRTKRYLGLERGRKEQSTGR